MFDLVIYHRNNYDGFASAWIAWRNLGFKNKKTDSPIIYYGEHPTATTVPKLNFNNKNILILDLYYNKRILDQIKSKAKSILIIDHHKSSKEANYGDSVRQINDQNHSAAYLTWKYFYPKIPVPPPVIFIEEIDLSRHKSENLAEFRMSLFYHFKLKHEEKYFKKWDRLLDEKYVSKMIKRGKIYKVYYNYIIKEKTRKLQGQFETKKVNNVSFIILNMCPADSQISNFLANKIDNIAFVLSWEYKQKYDSFRVTLRSKQFDITFIAEAFGKGGHPRAASFDAPGFKHIDHLVKKIEDIIRNR